MTHREDDAVALVERHDLGPGLSARPLLRQHELATREIPSRGRQEDGDLQREHVLPVHVLMQAVVVALGVLQEERRRLGLPGTMTAVEKVRVVVRVAHVDLHRLVPAVRDAGQGWV